MEKIILNRKDHSRINTWIGNAKQQKTISVIEAESLKKELQSAILVEPQDVPHDVVTMNSIVLISFIETKKQLSFQLVYPDQANVKENKISILSPIATALLGYKIGSIIEWLVPAGLTKIRIDNILYQPEAAGDYNS